MDDVPPPVDPVSAQLALRAEVERVTRVLRSVRNPGASAVGEWTVAQVAMHLSQAWAVVPALAARDISAASTVVPNLQRAADSSLLNNVWELGAVTGQGVESDEERDPKALAERITTRAQDYFAALATGPGLGLRPWLVHGVEVSVPTLTCHLLNETIVHGYDIAKADGQPWPIPRSHAALVFDGFLVPVIQALEPHALVDQERAAGVRVTYELRIRQGGRYIFAFDDGALCVDRPVRGRDVDCRISADPAALLLVAWGRRSQWQAIARGQLVSWGRKPWLGPRLRALMRNP